MPVAVLLASCANPQSGGGTELPIQVRIYVEVPTQATAWRLWSVEESPRTASTQTIGYSFVSRGVLKDSSGVLSIPNSPGTFLLEAWTRTTPSDSLAVVRDAPAGFAIDSSCIQSIPLDGQIFHTQACPQMRPATAPSGQDTARAPDRITMLRIPGGEVQRVQILDDAGARKLLPAEARLWSISTDPAEDQTLVFRGRLARESDGSFHFPTERGKVRYVVEAAETEGVLPTTIRSHAKMDEGWSRYLACQENILPPLPGTLSVHACPDLGWMPSGKDSAHSGANLWSVFATDLP